MAKGKIKVIGIVVLAILGVGIVLVRHGRQGEGVNADQQAAIEIGLPSQSHTRAGSPASRTVTIRTSELACADGWRSPSSSHCTRKGICGSTPSPFTPICRHRSSTPSGRRRLPRIGSLPSLRSARARSVTATTQPNHPPPVVIRSRTARRKGTPSTAGCSRSPSTST